MKTTVMVRLNLYMQMPISQMVKKLYTNSLKKTNNILRKLLSKEKKEKY